MEQALFFAFILLVVQQLFWMKVVNGLIAKLMSRNYHEYKQAEQLGKEQRRPVPQDVGQPDDLGILQDFHPGF